MAQFSRWTMVIFANEIPVEVEILTRGDGYTQIFYFAANNLIVNGRLFQVIEGEMVWLLQAEDIVLDAGIPPEL